MTTETKTIELAVHCDADRALQFLSHVRHDLKTGEIEHDAVPHLLAFLFRHMADFTTITVGRG